MEVGREEIAFVKNIFTVNKDLSGVTVTVKRIDDETSVPSGLTDIYQYLEVKLDKMTSEDVTKASIEFRVNSSWITSNNYDENSVVLNRHNNGWNELPTEFVSKDDAYHNYKAGTPGFSYFAIIAKAEKEVAEEVTGAAVVTPPEEKKPVVTPPAVANYVWLIVLIAVVAMVLVYLLVKKKKY